MPEASGAASGESGLDVVVGIDIGGTGTRFVALDPASYRTLAQTMHPTPAGGHQEEMLAFLRRHVERVAHGRKPHGLLNPEVYERAGFKQKLKAHAVQP